jgi:hypothetical protein
MIRKMNDTTNDQNTGNLINLTEHFYLSSRSQNRCIDAIREPEWPWFWNLEHNGQDRIFKEIEADPQHDAGFALYRDMLMDAAVFYGKLNHERYEELRTYKVWRDGKTPEGEKLFKHLLKKNILSTEQVQRLTTARAGESDLFLVISRNPVDYLFLSTNQNFHSCVSLDSEHDGAYYMGLPFYWVNAQTVLVFITNGKLKTRIIKGMEFKHFGYVGRSIATWNEDLSLMFHRWYPFEPELPIKPALREMGIQVATKQRDEWQTKGTFDDLKFANDEPCRPYLDIPYKSYPGRFQSWGSCGSPMNNSWEYGFEELGSLLDLQEPKRCEECGRRMDPDEDDMDDDICSRCNENFFVCERCDERTHNDDGWWVESEDITICDYCRRNYYERCYECDQLFRDRDVTTAHDGHTVCEDCLQNYEYCAECGEYFHPDNEEMTEHEGNWLCEHCWDEHPANPANLEEELA